MVTPYKKRQIKRDQLVHKRLHSLIAKPGAMKTACIKAVMKEFGFSHHQTVYDACKRVEARKNALL